MDNLSVKIGGDLAANIMAMLPRHVERFIKFNYSGVLETSAHWEVDQGHIYGSLIFRDAAPCVQLDSITSHGQPRGWWSEKVMPQVRELHGVGFQFFIPRVVNEEFLQHLLRNGWEEWPDGHPHKRDDQPWVFYKGEAEE